MGSKVTNVNKADCVIPANFSNQKKKIDPDSRRLSWETFVL